MPNWPVQMHGDVKAINDLGFDGIKLDSCGPSQHLAEWARLLNASGKPVLLENCFDNASFPFTKSGVDDGSEDVVAEDACPMNIFRSGGDMRADWPLMLRRHPPRPPISTAGPPRKARCTRPRRTACRR